MNHADAALFALNASRDYGLKIAGHLGIPLADHEEREFEDGEHKARPLQDIRGKDVFLVQSLYSDPQQSVNDKLCRLLFFIGALNDAGAARITAVLPYLCYARKDRKTQPWDPTTSRYTAQLLEGVGVDHVVTLDVHNLAAFQNAFRCTTDHLEARDLFADHFAPRLADERVTVISPDVGGIKRAELFRRTLNERLSQPATSAFMEKGRSGGVVTGDALIGDVAGRTAIIIDDLISTGTTIARVVHGCQQRGALRVYAAAAHGLFVGDAPAVLADPYLDKTVITDTIPPFRLPADVAGAKLTVLDAAGLFAKAVERLHGAFVRA
ncbi:MAG TPA: ribose-phosphate pyrophosphokinase [Gammaproteobacteria bacterium]|nr:ribose-phosphate pyrophosphokinase [Gammaproteobacteria bacterium]